MNKCYFTGRIASDPETRYKDDTAISTFSFAVDDGYGENKKTYFFDMTAFKKPAETVEKCCRKGMKLIIEARAQKDTWKDQNGNNRSAVKFIVSSFEFAEKKTTEPATEQTAEPVPDQDGFMPVPDTLQEDLPFN